MRPPLPDELQMQSVPLGTRVSAHAGTYARADANVTVRIQGDSSGVFQVVRVETDDVVRDPDGRHGAIDVLEPALVVGVVVGVDIDISPNAAVGTRPPLQIFWTVTEPEITDELRFDINVVPDIQEIIYDSGTLEAGFVRGWGQLAVHKNGDWFFRGHAHENGVVGDNYAFAIALKPIEEGADLHYAVQHGTVGGTVDPTWQVGPGDEVEGVKDIDHGIGFRVRCEGH